jgi:hypothetical protein
MASGKGSGPLDARGGRYATMQAIKLDTRPIVDWATFHNVFASVFGFPRFYGRNLNAWIDCMTWLDAPSAGMTRLHAPAGGVVVLELDDVDEFARRCPEQYQAIIECAAFVNWRKNQMGEPAVLALSVHKQSPMPNLGRPHSPPSADRPP